MLCKLKSNSGESLVESLASILIFTLASIVMFSLFAAAGRINSNAREWDEEAQRQIEAAERADVRTGSGTVTITLDGGTLASVAVDVYGGEDALFSFFAAGEQEDSP